MSKKSVEKTENEIKKTQKISKKPNKKINIQNSKFIKTFQNKTKIENKLEIKSIKLQNIGPFDEKGLTINFGKKLNTKKANIHIFVGENGCGKSTVLYGLEVIWKGKFENKILDKAIGKYTKENNASRIENSVSINNSHILSKKTDYEQFKLNPDNQKITYSSLFAERSVIEEKINLWLFAPFLYTNDHYFQIMIDGGMIGSMLLDKPVKDSYTKTYLKLELSKADKNDDLELKLEYFIKATEKKISDLLKQKFEFEYNRETDVCNLLLNGKKISYLGESDGRLTLLNIFFKIFIEFSEKITTHNLDYNSNFHLFLDEIDIHLHPTLQRKILPALQSLFPNAEIFCTTHSPFVVNSVSDAWVYELSEENYTNEKGEKWQEKDGMRFLNGRQSNDGESFYKVLMKDFNTNEKFSIEVEKLLNSLDEYIAKKHLTEENFWNDIIVPLSKRNTFEINQVLRFQLNKLNFSNQKIDKLWQK